MAEFYYNPDIVETPEVGSLVAEAQELQHTLSGIAFAAKDQAYAMATDSIRRLTASLHETGSFNLAVTLEGTNIISHIASYSPATGEEIVTPHHITASSHPLATHAPITGRLQGFSTTISTTGNTYHADINYRITRGDDTYTEHTPRQLHVLGPVASTQLTFDKDTHEKTVIAAFDTLIDHAQDIPTVRHVAAIDELLSPDNPDGRYDSRRIQSIGKSLRQFEEARGGADLHLRDGFIDLISARLGTYPGAWFALDSTRSYLLQGNKFHPTVRPISGDWELQGLEYATRATTAEGRADYTQPGSLSVVVEAQVDTQPHFVYVPFEDLFRLDPLDKPRPK